MSGGSPPLGSTRAGVGPSDLIERDTPLRAELLPRGLNPTRESRIILKPNHLADADRGPGRPGREPVPVLGRFSSPWSPTSAHNTAQQSGPTRHHAEWPGRAGSREVQELRERAAHRLLESLGEAPQVLSNQ